MSEKMVAKKLKRGDGVYCISKQDAGAIHKAAKAYKTEMTSFWTRKRGKGSK